jgi:eukaryotic-like serine/threonine-protein kinase
MNRIGKYEVIAPLGHGGSGSVFRAYDPVMARPVAIKLLNDSIDSKELPKLRSEARAAGRLHHRNIVSIFDLAEEEGKPYLVMELLEGADLSHSIPPDTPMGIRQSVEIMHQVAQGLLHAHSHGVVHRDVSPQNIWLVPDGTVKLIDFGLAGGFQGGRTLTNTDSPLGTVLFFSRTSGRCSGGTGSEI